MTIVVYKKSFFNVIYNKLKILLFNFITKKTLKLFFLGGDLINNSMINGYHEDHLVALIKNFANSNHNHYFIDIGSNTGLITCQIGNLFKNITMYEPNLILADLSKLNIKLAFSNKDIIVNSYGLGENNAEYDLFIPKHNWGGAFIKDNNFYNDDIIASKDGFKKFNINNYIVSKVLIKSADCEFLSLFNKLNFLNLVNGVIKIDVEGYESIVINSLSRTLPKNFSSFIIFESWDENLNFKALIDSFNGRAKGFYYKKSLNKNILNNYFINLNYLLIPYQTACPNKNSGDLILYVKSQHV